MNEKEAINEAIKSLEAGIDSIRGYEKYLKNERCSWACHDDDFYIAAAVECKQAAIEVLKGMRGE